MTQPTPNESNAPSDSTSDADPQIAGVDDNADTSSADASSSVAPSNQHDPDAAWGVKTKKSGGEETFFGYHEHTVVRVPHGKQERGAEPRVIARFELIPANTDFVDVSLSLLDRLARPAEKLIVDRLYPYATPDRWRDPLVDRGIDQIFDLRSDQHGFVELNSTRWAAGWSHCPATPDQYGTIPRPLPSATAEEKRKYRRRIAARQQWAFRSDQHQG